MKKWICGVFAAMLICLLATPVSAALPSGTGIIKSCTQVSGSEFSSKSSIAKKLDKMFAGDIGLYKDAAKTKLVDAALGTSNVPNNDVYQYWGPDSRAGTSCFAYANAFYGHFYDGVYPHHSLNSNHKTIKATGKITYNNFVKWGVRNDAVVYIREGNHSIIVLHYDENYITYVDGNGNAKGLIALRKEAWKRGTGANIYDQKPSLIVQPTTSYFAAGSMNGQTKPCTEGGPSHDWDEGKITQKATCKEAGIKLFTCLDCGKTREDSLKKTSDHKYGDWTVAQEPTCTKKGKQVRICAVCGGENSKSIKALGHSYGKSVVTQEGSLFTPGITQRTCKTCGKVLTTKSQCVVEIAEFGLTLSAKEGVFPKKTELTVAEPQDMEGAQERLRGVSAKSLIFEIQTQSKDQPVQPKGKVDLEIKIPEDFSGNLGLYEIFEGEAVSVPSQIDPEGGVLTAQVDRFGTFALCDLNVPWRPEPKAVTEPTAAPTVATEVATEPTAVAVAAVQPAQINRELLLWVCVASSLVMICLILVIILIVRRIKRKKSCSQETEEPITE